MERKQLVPIVKQGGYVPVLQSKTATPSKLQQLISADEDYDGLSSVTVEAVTSAIDDNIVPGNIKEDVEILGVTGTMKTPTGTISITENGIVDVTNYASASVLVADSGTATAKGLADGSLTSFSAPALGVTSLKPRRFENFTSLQSLNLTGVTNIPEYSAYGCTGLTSLTIDPNTTNIGNYAFYGCNNNNLAIDLNMNGTVGSDAFHYAKVRSVKGTYSIGSYAFSCDNGRSILDEVDIKVNGYISGYAFGDYNRTVSSFNLDPTSVVAGLGQHAFYNFGSNRANASTNVFYFDFRNSTFTSVESSAFAGDYSYKNKYMNIYFPSTMATIAQNVFQYTDHLNIYYKNIPTLSNTNNFNSATNFKNFFPYNLVQTAKTSTNWSSSTNNIVSSIYGYAEENTFTQGQTLPLYDNDGYELTWYNDVAMTNQVTVVSDPSQIYYCAVGSRVAVPLTITEYQATCTISDGVNTYSSGDMIMVGTTVTITAVGDTGYPDPYTFTVNGTTIASGDTFTATDVDISIICIYYDGVNPPVDPVFANNTPQQVKIAVDNGLHRTLWTIGDTRVITLTNNQQVTMRYIDQVANRYQKSDLSGYTNAVFEFTTLPMTAQMNTSNTNVGGCPASAMCTVTMPQIYDLLPSDWKAVFSQSRIPSAQSGSSSTIVYADNYAFIPSGQEMYGNSYVTNYYYDEGCTQFDYYRINSANSYKIKQYNGSNYYYWLRSPYRSGSSSFCGVRTDGSFDYSNAASYLGVSVCLPI